MKNITKSVLRTAFFLFLGFTAYDKAEGAQWLVVLAIVILIGLELSEIKRSTKDAK